MEEQSKNEKHDFRVFRCFQRFLRAHLDAVMRWERFREFWKNTNTKTHVDSKVVNRDFASFFSKHKMFHQQKRFAHKSYFLGETFFWNTLLALIIYFWVRNAFFKQNMIFWKFKTPPKVVVFEVPKEDIWRSSKSLKIRKIIVFASWKKSWEFVIGKKSAKNKLFYKK